MIRALFKSNGFILIPLFLVLLFQMTRWGSYLFAAFIIIAAFSRIWRNIDKNVLFLALFSISLCILCPKIGFSTYGFICFMGPCTFYMLGKRMANKTMRDENQLIFLFLLVIIFESILMWIGVLNNIRSGGSLIIDAQDMGRMLRVEGGVAITATLFGLIASMGISGLGILFGIKNRNHVIPWLFFLCFLLSLITTFYLINRTAIVVGLVALAIVTAYRANNNVFRLVLMLVLIVLLGFAVFYTGLIDQQVISAYSSRMGDDIGGGGDRFWRWKDAIVRMFSFPLGWINQTSPYNYVHNMWLDVARMGGVFPFFFLLIPTIISLRNTYRIFKKKNSNLSVVILSLYTCMFIASFMEPVIEGCVYFFLLFCWLWGIEQVVAQKYTIRSSIR